MTFSFIKMTFFHIEWGVILHWGDTLKCVILYVYAPLLNPSFMIGWRKRWKGVTYVTFVSVGVCVRGGYRAHRLTWEPFLGGWRILMDLRKNTLRCACELFILSGHPVHYIVYSIQSIIMETLEIIISPVYSLYKAPHTHVT